MKGLSDTKAVNFILKKINCNEEYLSKLIPELKIRAKNLIELVESAKFLQKDFNISDNMTEKAKESIEYVRKNGDHVVRIVTFFEKITDFTHQNLYEQSQEFCKTFNLKLKYLSGFVRSCLTGSHISPSIFKIMEVFGYKATSKLLNAQIIKSDSEQDIGI